MSRYEESNRGQGIEQEVANLVQVQQVPRRRLDIKHEVDERGVEALEQLGVAQVVENEDAESVVQREETLFFVGRGLA